MISKLFWTRNTSFVDKTDEKKWIRLKFFVPGIIKPNYNKKILWWELVPHVRGWPIFKIYKCWPKRSKIVI
jgi:hypothetical protein